MTGDDNAQLWVWGGFSWMDNAHSTHGHTQQAPCGEKHSQNHFQAFYWTSGEWLKSMQNRTRQPFKPQHEIVTKKCIYNDTQQLQSMSKRVLVSLWTRNDKNEYCGSIVIGSEFAVFDSPSSHIQIIVKTHRDVPKGYQIKWYSQFKQKSPVQES